MTETQTTNADILKSVLARLDAIKTHAEVWSNLQGIPNKIGQLRRMDEVLEGIANHEGWDISAIT